MEPTLENIEKPKLRTDLTLSMSQGNQRYDPASASREFSPLTKQERKLSANIKWFTSQITNELPGPKIPTTTTSMYALNRFDKNEQ